MNKEVGTESAVAGILPVLEKMQSKSPYYAAGLEYYKNNFATESCILLSS